MTKMGRKLIGHVGVDAGLMWVGDPCYVIGETDEDRTKEPEWHKNWAGGTDSFCNMLQAMDAVRPDGDEDRSNVYPFSFGLATEAEVTLDDMLKSNRGCAGIAVSSGWGDGLYPVYIEYEGGRVKSVTVEFIGEEDENEAEDEDEGWCYDCDNPDHECTCEEE